MKYKKLYNLFLQLCLILVCFNSNAQDCPTLNFPANGSTEISTTATISWNDVPGVTAYIISLGTTPNGIDILNRQNVGSATSYTPPLGLPETTQIYFSIRLFRLGGLPDIVCESETFLTTDVLVPPACTTITSPMANAINVNVGANIRWDYAPFATGYLVAIGTSPNGTEIANNVEVFNRLTYNPPTDLPPNTTIYVRVTSFNENNPTPTCQEISFTTADVAPLPGCTSLISPTNGETNVPLTPFIEWNAVPGATGYLLSIGSSPFERDVLDNASFTTNATFVIDFEPNRTFFVTIIPFNKTGQAIGCTQESFSTILGCGPYFDSVTGELTFLNPEINIPDEIAICLNAEPTIFTSTDIAEGFRWYRIISNTNETLVSETAEVSLTQSGIYRYEAYNTVSQEGATIECPTSKTVNVVSSEIPRIEEVKITETIMGLTFDVEVTGIGSYEYAIDDINGTYQDNPVFTNITQGNHTVYVRDKNGCGSAQETIRQDLSLEGFPKFFTPNGDGINDYWQFISSPEIGTLDLDVIFIFTRFGSLIAQIDPNSRGWDGTFNGNQATASDYWFRATTSDQRELKGHFTLKR